MLSNDYFGVQGDQLVVNGSINYDLTGISVQVTIVATDRGGLSYEQTIPVFIENVITPADARTTYCQIYENS